MNNNLLLLGVLFGAFFLLRRPSPNVQWESWLGSPWQEQLAQPSDLGRIGYMGGQGTGYGIDVWGDEG